MISQQQHAEPVRGSLGEAMPGIDSNLLFGTEAERLSAGQQVREACLTTGFFCLDNLLDRSPVHRSLIAQMQRFFALSDDDPVKQAINVTGHDNTYGWMPLFGEPAYQPGTVAHVESFDCGRAQRGSDDPLLVPSRWPAIPGFENDVRAAWDELTGAGMTVLRGLAAALELDPGFFAERCSSQDRSTMRLLHYPATEAAAATENSVGIAAHTDFECITLISQTAPGLELMDVNGDWYDAPARDDRLVVLIGDMLERWTNGAFRATGHRVRTRNWSRYSVVLFFGVNEDVLVSPLRQFVADGDEPRYAPTRQGEHIRAELARAERNRDELADTK